MCVSVWYAVCVSVSVCGVCECMWCVCELCGVCMCECMVCGKCVVYVVCMVCVMCECVRVSVWCV